MIASSLGEGSRQRAGSWTAEARGVGTPAMQEWERRQRLWSEESPVCNHGC